MAAVDELHLYTYDLYAAKYEPISYSEKKNIYLSISEAAKH